MSIKHETCLEYSRRRLSEGWKCISLEGYNAVLLSPDGIRRKVDLRNDILTLAPNADSTPLELTALGGGDHYIEVDEQPDPDEDSTRVYTTSTANKVDLYGLPNHTTESGTINSVKAYARCRYTAGVSYGQIKIKTHATVYSGDEETLPPFDYTTYSKTWSDNPNTLTAWTWAEVDALEAGIQLRTGGVKRGAHCTQVYVEVDYTPPVGWTGKISGVTNPAKIMGVAVANIAKVKGVA